MTEGLPTVSIPVATMKPLPVMYQEWLATAIDAKGVELPFALTLNDVGDLTVYALALPVPDAYRLMAATWAAKKPREMIFAFDRFAKPGQGTTLGDLMAGFHFIGYRHRPFIVEYQHSPRIVKQIAWDNVFWNAALTGELVGTLGELWAGK